MNYQPRSLSSLHHSALALVLGLAFSYAPAQAAQYRVVTYPNASLATAVHGINDNSEVVGGFTHADTSTHAMLWTKTGSVDLGILGCPVANRMGCGAVARAVNNNKQIAGHSHTDAGRWYQYYPHSFLWENGQMRAITTVGNEWNYAYDINKSGVIAGFGRDTFNYSYTNVGYVWVNNQRVITIGNFGGNRSSMANAINNRNQVVGCASSSDGGQKAFLWQDNSAVLGQNPQLTNLGTLGGLYSCAQDINNLGHIVGAADINSTSKHAVLWKNGQIVDLGTIGNIHDYSRAVAINDLGQIIGDFDSRDEVCTPPFACQFQSVIRHFVWENGVMKDVNSLIVDNRKIKIVEFGGINNKGEISARGTVNNQQQLIVLVPM